MFHLLQITDGVFTFELGVYWGILLGIRTYEPTEAHNQYELHCYIPFIYTAFVKKRQED